jgi:predicted GNAT family acetyltransferase
MELEIKHDEQGQTFFAEINGEKALLEYYSRDDETLVFNHTFVPASLRDRGIAAGLTKYALNYAREHNFKVIPQCPYVAEYVERNKEFDDIISA